MTPDLLLAAVPALPVLGGVAALLLPRRAGVPLTAALAASFLLLVGLAAAGAEPAPRAAWLEIGGLQLTLGLRFDGLARVASLFVAGVALPVAVYSLGYVRPARRRYFALLGLFAGAMLALVLADSLLLLYAAWEVVGLASFLLIAHEDQDPEAVQAGRRAFLTTRIGDMGLLLGWVAALLLTGTTDLQPLLDRAPEAAPLAALFLLAALGKSAQLPFTAWLPRAMAGPTPVSALLHSATMVAAGVFLLLRLFPLFQAAPGVLAAILVLGAATAVTGALSALAAVDLKRILAWSTVSQLGEMMLAVGLAGPLAAAFHLLVHGTSKAALFLAAGAVERATGERRVDRLAGLARAMPWTAGAFGLAAVSLAGMPLLSGELILGAALERSPGLAVLVLLLIGLAGAYLGRAGSAFLGPARPEAREAAPLLLVPALVLAGAAAAAGLALKGPLAHALPFPAPGEVPAGWKAMAGLAGAAGLAAGLLALRRTAFPDVLARLLDGGTLLGARMAMGLARVPESADRALDAGAVALGGAAGRLARGARVPDGALDAGAAALGRGVLRLARFGAGAEAGLDRLAGRAGAAALRAAGLSEIAEARGFGRGGDRLGGSLPWLGDRLRGLQTGKLFLYTLTLFAWAAAVGVAALILAV